MVTLFIFSIAGGGVVLATSNLENSQNPTSINEHNTHIGKTRHETYLVYSGGDAGFVGADVAIYYN